MAECETLRRAQHVLVIVVVVAGDEHHHGGEEGRRQRRVGGEHDKVARHRAAQHGRRPPGHGHEAEQGRIGRVHQRSKRHAARGERRARQHRRGKGAQHAVDQPLGQRAAARRHAGQRIGGHGHHLRQKHAHAVERDDEDEDAHAHAVERVQPAILKQQKQPQQQRGPQLAKQPVVERRARSDGRGKEQVDVGKREHAGPVFEARAHEDDEHQPVKRPGQRRKLPRVARRAPGLAAAQQRDGKQRDHQHKVDQPRRLAHQFLAAAPSGA